MIDDDRIPRLPKYAQDLILRLTRERDEARAELNGFLKARPESDTEVVRYGADASGNLRLEKGATVRFALPDGYWIEARVTDGRVASDGDGMCLEIHARGPLNIRPRVSNRIWLTESDL